MSIDLGLLIARVVVGALLAGHGAQKLFGWFGGHGIEGTAGWLGSIGIKRPKFAAYAAGLSEFLGGLGLLFGFLTPVAAALVAGVMLVAASTHLSKGIWAHNGGFELPLTNIAIAVLLGLSGAGHFSADALLGIFYSPLTYIVAQVAVFIGLLPSLIQIHAKPVQTAAEQA